MIGELQGEFGDLDIKYLKQKYLKMSVGNIRKLQENTTAVHVWLGRRYQRTQICLTGEVETSSSPIRMWYIRMQNVGARNVFLSHPAMGYLNEVEFQLDRILPRVQGVGTPLPDDTERAWISGFPGGKAAQCYPVQLHLNNSIYYPNMLSGWKTFTKVSERALLLPTFHRCPMVCPDSLSGHLFPWIPKNSPFQRALLNLGLLWRSKSYQNTKT